MSLPAGSRVGPFEIVAQLGAGGMGEVYRARDARLGRDVAIKSLPAAVAQDVERVARFEREARLLASLSHPNIGSIYGVEQNETARYLVLELIEGETIAARLASGALPLDEALAIARQVASALEAAHESGVVHRDLKPGNVMVTPAGTAKVLDFGLARASTADHSNADANLSASPTMTHAGTQAGMILGTAAYMSPEQARGKPVDRRADIWSFGCLLYEMLTGRKAFAGETVSDTLAAILKCEPDWTALPKGTPRRVADLLRRCLRKDTASRLRDAGDARIEIEEILADASDPEPPVTRAIEPARRARWTWLAAATLLAIAALAAGWALRGISHRDPERAPIRFMITAPPATSLPEESDAFVISPDGRALAFVAVNSSGSRSLWVRELASLAAHPIAGTDNARSPFWSPDSRSLGFFADGKMKKIALAGGSSEVLCDTPDARGGSWGSRNTIVFTPAATGSIFSISAAGGKIEEVLAPDVERKETSLRFPRLLPDGRHFLFVSLPRRDGSFEVHLGDMETKQRWPIVRASAVPAWAAPGYLIFVQNDLLLAQRFDVEEHRLSGEPVSLGPAPIVMGHDGLPAVSASDNGVLVRSSAVLADTRMRWLDRSGQAVGEVPLPAGRWEDLQISPDAQRAAVLRRISANQTDVWIVDLTRGLSSRFTPSIRSSRLLWSPDGRRLLYQLNPDGPEDLYVRSIDSGGAPEPLYRSPVQFKNAWQWTSDGRFITFNAPDPQTGGWDGWILPLDGDRKPFAVVHSPANEIGPWLSPDQHWLAYTSDESGRDEAYVQPFPGPGARLQLTSTGLPQALIFVDWSADGRELLVASGEVLAIALEPGKELRIGPTRPLFKLPPDFQGFDVTSDHQRFLVTVPGPDAVPPAIAVDANWTASLPR